MTTLLILTLMAGMAQAPYQPTWESIDSRPNPQWFEDAKFGVFIVWGVYSVPAWGPKDRYAEWYWYDMQNRKSETGKFHEKAYGVDVKYQDFAHRFKAELFDPDHWADIVVRSGAKYTVFTTKFHDGFSMWPDEYNWNWNAKDIGPHRDLVGDVTDAMRNRDIRVGFYYSLYEWFNPLYNSDVDRYVDTYMLPQMKSLVERYKPDLIWPDGEWDYPSETWRSTEFLAWLYNESPVKDEVVVNDRWGEETRGKHGGIWTTEYDLVHNADANEMEIEHYWEECRGIGTSFGYNRNEYLENYSTSEELVEILINKVARGGNLLLNIGPTADGRIPVIMQQRLVDMGDWLAVNGEAIYGTRKWDDMPAVTPDTKTYFTRKGRDLYVLCTEFPTRPFTVENIKSDQVTMLGFSGKINTALKGSTLTIDPPIVSPATNPCDHAWVFKISDAI